MASRPQYRRRFWLPSAAAAYTWSFVANGTLGTGSSGNQTLTEPAGAQQGDLLVAFVGYRDSPAFSNADWTFVSQLAGDTTAGGATALAGGFLAYCVRGASAPSYIFTRTAGSLARGRVVAYRPSGGTISLDDWSENQLGVGAGSTTGTTGALDTTASNVLIFAGVAGARDASPSAFDAATDPSTASGSSALTSDIVAGTWVLRMTSTTATAPQVHVGAADGYKATAGNTGTIQATSSLSSRSYMAAAAFKLS